MSRNIFSLLVLSLSLLAGSLSAQSGNEVAPVQAQPEVTPVAADAVSQPSPVPMEWLVVPEVTPVATDAVSQPSPVLMEWLIVSPGFSPTATESDTINTEQTLVEGVRRLRLFHTHSNQHIDIVYREGDQYIPEAIDQLDHFLRDSRNGEVNHFDPRLFDLLTDLTASLGRPDVEINVLCGYRTPSTNAFLRRRSRRVARHSLHMEAMAMDIRVPGVTAKQLRDAALQLHRGGVGYYRRSNFVHVDVGPVRRW